MSEVGLCTVGCQLNKFEHITRVSLHSELQVEQVELLWYGRLGQRGPCMVERGGVQEGLHCGEGAKRSLYGGDEVGLGLCNGTPCEQTHIRD